MISISFIIIFFSFQPLFRIRRKKTGPQDGQPVSRVRRIRAGTAGNGDREFRE